MTGWFIWFFTSHIADWAMLGCALGCGVLTVAGIHSKRSEAWAWFTLALWALASAIRPLALGLAFLLLGGCCISPFCTGPKEETTWRS